MKDKEIVIGGIFPVLEALQKGVPLEKILIKKDLGGPNIIEIKTLAIEAKIPIQQVPIEKLNRETGIRHQGVVAFQSFVEYQDIESIIPMIFERGETPLGLILDRISDVRNFGAICRTAECMGCHFVVIPKKNAAKINDDAMKTSAGAINHLNICRVSNLSKTISFLQESGLQIIGASEKAEKDLFESDFTIPTAIVMGSEKDGISQDISNKLNEVYQIPLVGEVKSLNVSVAAGMFLIEVNRQRK
ncbi:MAG: 23S rRNA (guanosine2251-2'-O)-methyltransferase [Patiriisocius sp.]|jgi:23S rRNA (guanosine2251-2'-O)-methyltransferase